MIYIDDTLEAMTEEMYRSALAEISEQRREAAGRYKHFDDRKRCVCAYRLLQEALRVEYGIVSPPLFAYNEHGKPFLRDYPHIHFSLSHCRRAVVCAVGDEPVGIDVEDVKPVGRELMAYTCSEAECAEIEASLAPDWTFARLWTMKESTYKLEGTGLRDNLKSVLSIAADRYRYQSVAHHGKGYIYTLCRKKD